MKNMFKIAYKPPKNVLSLIQVRKTYLFVILYTKKSSQLVD